MDGIKDLVSKLNERYNHKLHDLWVAEYESAIELKSIVVSKRYQGQGIGKSIIADLKDYAKKVNKPIVLTMAPSPRKRASLQRFYKSLGFRIPGRSKNSSYPSHTHIYTP